MNSVFKHLLRKIVLLFAKRRKCTFSATTIEYLGHVISAGTASTDPIKVHSVMTWPTPKSVKELRQFLGLSTY
ncbi:Retrovirus-related Pol polyprotein from transposon 297 family [Gossypium australe]|uniref:Retrovirus-related Pol polyprotein from transposon 297 family n=1 Tax=Gossypium australe TaxID=47621 RepID=A0A5B6WTT7_9ROSI|nr:Retrovirus-related Pol polyprotein from transposon 297 family [Gossypium australe]